MTATVMERINGVDHQLEQAVSEVGATVQDGNTSWWPAKQDIRIFIIFTFRLPLRKYRTTGDNLWWFFLIFFSCGFDRVLIRSNKRELKAVPFKIKLWRKEYNCIFQSVWIFYLCPSVAMVPAIAPPAAPAWQEKVFVKNVCKVKISQYSWGKRYRKWRKYIK